MLQEIIQDLQSSLKNYSQGLAKQNLLVDIPWTMVDGDLNLQRLIFKKDNSLYIVREGEIQESKWEYLPSLNSLVIELGDKKILLNEIFADEKALILKKDGQSTNFLAFANQKNLPNLNLIEYFKSLQKRDREINEPEEMTHIFPRPISNSEYVKTTFEPEHSRDWGLIIISVLVVSVIIFFLMNK